MAHEQGERGVKPAIPEGPIVSLVYRVPIEKREELLGLMGKAFPFYERPGGIRMGLFESMDESGIFMELVAYASETDHAADEKRLETPEYQDLLVAWRSLIDGDPQVLRMRPVKVHALTAQVKPVSVETIRALWRDRWGIPIYTVGGHFQPEAVEGLGAYSGSSELAGLVTWVCAGEDAEILTLDALKPRAGVGTALLQAVEAKVRAQSIKSVRALTTNDNTPAVALLQKTGYRLVRVHPDAVTDIRRAKPQIPERGKHGIPMRDLWELRKEL